jgi:molecular chaperone DnaJ
VPTLEGPITVKLHPGTQPGEVIRLKSKGMPRFRGYGKGDLVIRVGISVPEKLTQQQRALLEQLAKEFNQDVQPKSRKFHFQLQVASCWVFLFTQDF